MHDRTWIADLEAGTEATLYGWVRHRRVSGKLVFLQVRDGSGEIQAVVKGGRVPDAVGGLCQESAWNTATSPSSRTWTTGRPPS